MKLKSALVPLVLLALAPLAAQAQSFRCVGKDGKKYYGSSVPPQCVGVTVEQLNSQGTVIKRIDPQASADDRAKKAADEAEQKKQAAATRDQGRRDQALLATYASEKDVEDMRRRALEDNQALIKDLEGKIAALKSKGGGGSELTTQENLLATKRKEVAAINARYDEDKRRYIELKRGK